MKKQKKDPLYKSFGYAFAGIFRSEEHTSELQSLTNRRIRISYYTGRVVYLPDIVWSCHGIGNGEYGGRSSG